MKRLTAVIMSVLLLLTLLPGCAKNEGFDGRYDMMTALFIAIAFLFLADWTVYCYEKYQLR